jgi:hypothetical protein
MNKRTSRDFKTDRDPAPLIDAWAGESGYGTVMSNANGRLYEKFNRLILAPMMVEAKWQGKEVHLEAWIRGTALTRLFSLFIVPKEIGIESGGWVMALPRKAARIDLNNLLQRFDQPPVP